MRAEGRLLVFLVQVAVFNPVLRYEATLTRGLGERRAAAAGRDLSVSEDCLLRIESKFLRNGFAELDARRINPRRGVVAPGTASACDGGAPAPDRPGTLRPDPTRRCPRRIPV